MIFENVELHNVAETTPAGGGARLQRVPEPVRAALNPGAQMRMLQPDNAEIRFVADGPTARVTLSSEGETDVTLFHGLFDGRRRFTLREEPLTIEVAPPERLLELDVRHTSGMAFSPRVFRLILGGRRRDPVVFHSAEGGGVRPPGSGETPRRRYLAYGTSITHGFDAEGPHLSYVAWVARLLGADLINLGVGGAAHCEPALADYIAGRGDWDFATLALSVNMQGFPMDEFSRRVSYMVNTVSGAEVKRLVACITLFPYFRDLGIEPPGVYGGTSEEYREALRNAVASCPHRNVRLIEGPEALTVVAGLTLDLIHPGDYGMCEMGHAIAARLGAWLDAGR